MPYKSKETKPPEYCGTCEEAVSHTGT